MQDSTVTIEDFNPRSPCGERRAVCQELHNLPAISIHAPLVGSDSTVTRNSRKQTRFQSTLPLWGATVIARLQGCGGLDFNPRSPCGERPADAFETQQASTISIHAPLVGSDMSFLFPGLPLQISIHAPLVGSDLSAEGVK